MKKLFFKIIVLLSVLIVIDIIFGIVFRHVIDISPDGRYYKANYSLSECDEDIIIFGSSRAETNYAPFVFEDSLKLSTWNTGRGGQSLPFWYAMELGILDDNIPKIAVVNIESDFLSGDMSDSYQRAGFLRPYYFKHDEIHPVIDKISKSEKYLMFSNLYAFNSSFYYLLRPFLLKGLDGEKELKGWKTRNGVIKKSNNDYMVYNPNQTSLNKDAIKLFNKFIYNLTDIGCDVYIVISPNYKTLIDYSPTIEYVSHMKGVTFLDYSNNKHFVDNHLYYKDHSHLNIEGAIEFSKHISQEIKNNINKARTHNNVYKKLPGQ
ncbi:MAG: hypothetical protein KDC90_18780 [Ignavibacteriae bacterium]|nr:hypothetical protein [Ignavibacteriota bacterium]